MTTNTTPTNESFSLDNMFARDLEASQIENSIQSSPDQSPKQIVQFQQYHHDNYQNQSVDNQSERKKHVFRMMQQRQGELALIVQYRQKIEVLMNKIIELNEKVFYFQDYNTKLLSQNQSLKQRSIKDLNSIQQLQTIIWKKDDMIAEQILIIDSLNIKVVQSQNSCKVLADEIIIEKDLRIRDLCKKVQKLIAINKSRQDEIRDATDKIVQLQKQIQANAYHQILQNRSKLKQAIGFVNKQNQQQNYRKSLESTFQRRNRLSNFPIPVQRKQKSYSSIGKIRIQDKRLGGIQQKR